MSWDDDYSCPKGYYCDPNKYTYDKCHQGYFCTANAQEPLPCPWGVLSCPRSGMVSPDSGVVLFLFCSVLIGLIVCGQCYSSSSIKRRQWRYKYLTEENKLLGEDITMISNMEQNDLLEKRRLVVMLMCKSPCVMDHLTGVCPSS
jgi:hypothetical protein